MDDELRRLRNQLLYLAQPTVSVLYHTIVAYNKLAHILQLPVCVSDDI
jgi:hypothetical protein